jgi:hypothetical protein
VASGTCEQNIIGFSTEWFDFLDIICMHLPAGGVRSIAFFFVISFVEEVFL